MRRTTTTFGLLAVLIPVLCAPAPAQTTFEEMLETTIVEVPVHVIHEGKPVRGLTAANFEIYDGRQRQDIVGFEVVDLTGAQRDGSAIEAVPLSARRHFLLVFDVSFSDPLSVTRARHAAKELVATSLHPTDLVGVATYSILQGPRLVLGFTPDRDQVAAAIETLGLSQLADSLTDPLALLITEPGSQSAVTSAEASGGSRTNFDADAVFQENVRDLKVGTDRLNQDQARNQLLAMSRGMEDLARLLNNVEGRKHVVLLSEGIDSTSILGTADAGRTEEMARAVETGEHWRVNSDERYGNTSSLNVLQTMLEEFRRADTVIQAVDISNLRGGSVTSQNTLFIMADETGGELIRNFNDPRKAMEKVLDHTSVTYLLAFQPEDLKADGEFHKLRVKLVNGPRKAEVIHRPGYYAPRPFEETNELERRFAAADQILSGRESGVITSSIFAAPFWFQEEKAYVPILLEIGGPSLLAGKGDSDVLTLEIYAYAIARSGSVQDFLTQRMGLEIGKVRPVFEQSGLKFFGSMDLPPGEYELRTLVREADTGRSSTRSFALTVPEKGGSPYLMAPMVAETPGKWLMVREQGNDDQARGIPYPFMQGGEAFIPAARPQIAAGQPARLLLKGYNLEGDSGIRAKVLSAEGEEIQGPSVALLAAEAAGSDAMEARFDPKGLEKGSYVLVVEMAGADGATASTTMAFDVVG